MAKKKAAEIQDGFPVRMTLYFTAEQEKEIKAGARKAGAARVGAWCREKLLEAARVVGVVGAGK